ncbi:transmembrane protein 60 [Pangasianodon hypophthalmus]|uniref:transmembrane protein 60 n=1 Tax=Pangasianodon hypophthalmus TaxID=310915 RepID=UPI000EFEEA1C|nr:transmembrane protein 60 [Pangasianodon hypophthalmus]
MSMSLAQRVLLTWIFSLIFLIMLVLKLDDKIHWNWFLVFLPVWTFDTILLLMLIVKMAGRCKPGFDPRNAADNLKKRVWYLVAILLKLAFSLLLCARLERLTETYLSFICIPLWALLIGAMVELGYNVFHF